jgi:hypothetical protein
MEARGGAVPAGIRRVNRERSRPARQRAKVKIARERAQDGGRLARDATREEGVGQRQGQERDPAGAPR